MGCTLLGKNISRSPCNYLCNLTLAVFADSSRNDGCRRRLWRKRWPASKQSATKVGEINVSWKILNFWHNFWNIVRYFGKLPLPPMQCVPTQSVPLSHGPGSKFLSRAQLTLHAIQCHLDNQGSSKLIVDLVIKSSTNSQVRQPQAIVVWSFVFV